MHMFGLEGSGFIIALGVTLLVSGAIVYYCNSRIAALEKALVQQNQVLSDFIVNMRTSLENQASIQQISSIEQNAVINDHATDTAVEAAKAYYSDTVPENKIEVSEDNGSEEDSDDENESDLESESELESDSDEEEEDIVSENIEDSDDENSGPIVLTNNSEEANLEIDEVQLESSETREDKQNQQILLTNAQR